MPSLRQALSACTYCQDTGLIPEARPVFQLPRAPTIGIFGQAPGNMAHQEGRPFADPSGVRLRQWMSVTEDEFYHSGRIAIVPMGFCFPGYNGKGATGKGGDLPPPKVCAERWRAQVLAEIMPSLRVILLVGQYAQRWHLQGRMKKTLTETVADYEAHFSAAKNGAALYIPIAHPSWRNVSWLKKNPWFEEKLVPKMQRAIRTAL